jgi:hypothetical protein
MAVIVAAPPALSGELSLFHTTDPLLSNTPILVFHGPAATIGVTSSRIQVHIFTPAGWGSYARLAVSPNSPFYSAVSNLPREEQGDELCRGLAFALKKYFVELSDEVKKSWCAMAKAPSSSALFGDEHVAILATRMAKIENVDEVIGEIRQAFGEQRMSWLDVDLVLPCGSIKDNPAPADALEVLDESQFLTQRYGKYAEVIDALGEVAFLPTSKVKRAPSKSTSIGRSASFLRHQKENVRKELSELLDTEESYVSRVTELHDTAKSCIEGSSENDADKLRAIFPTTIEDIAKLNGEFFESLRTVVDGTEQNAIEDIQAMTDEQPTAQQARQDLLSDTQGIGAVAGCLCEWLPKFSSTYNSYMKAHAEAAKVLSKVFKGDNAELVSRLQEIGEQKLTSLLIEPVQRLPRYNLYIDSIVKQLPVRHPAIKSLLRARDVVTAICDSSGAEPTSATEILQARTSNWPKAHQPLGRLVTAADIVQLEPLYTSQGCTAGAGMLVLFTDSLVFLRKHNSKCTARVLLTELESGRPATTTHDLTFVRRVKLDAITALECQNGEALQIVTSFKLDEAAHPPSQMSTSSECVRFEGYYERKAERFAEEISKAKVEGRFSESEREGLKWEVRSSDPTADTVSLFSAVFEDSNPEYVATRSSRAETHVIVDIDRHAQKPRAGQNGIRTVVAVSPQRDGLWRLSFDSIDGSVIREHATASDLVAVLRRRLTTLAAARFSIDQPSMTACLLSRNINALQSLNVQIKADEEDLETQESKRDRLPRPKSPRKMLSNFLSSTGPGSQPPAFLKKDLPPLPPSRLPSSHSGHSVVKPPSRESRPTSKDHATPMSTASMRSTEQLASPIKKLEETLSTYLLALQARKGNIVGRSLKMRASADELAVNELYNSLLEDPNMMVLAAQATVDVLFAAFEKFLNNAWKEQVGQVLPYATMQVIQSKAETLFPIDFDEFFRSTVSSLPPQNQRAFKAIITLLADLLDGTGNDGDRGILTAAFAEVLVTEGNPRDYIALIDRFVDDPDTYFGEPLEEVQKTTDGGFNPHKRARSVNSASISSNTSSLRRKFGFGGLSRENSKSEQESKVASVWRTLSKSTRGDASPGNSISKGSLHRSYSTDAPPRPISQDGSASIKSLVGEDLSFSGVSSQLNLGLSTIGEHPSFIPKVPPKKKRRSSLSDLPTLDSPGQKSPAWSPPAVRRPPPPVTQRYMDEKSLPNSPMPSTPSSKGGSGRFGSPPKETPRSRLPPSFRKENSPDLSKAYATSPEQRPKSSGSKPDEVVITSRLTSGIPTLTPKPLSPQKHTSPAPLRSGLAERPGAGNIIKKPSPPPDKFAKASASTPADAGSPTKRLRMQSPQKLRERLQNEQRALSTAQTSLQDELNKIGDELTSTPSRLGSVRTSSHTRSKSNASQATNMDLAQRVLKMEGQLPQKMEEFNERIASIQADISTSLTVSENKCKKLDELYREANSENEALYARFNDELGRILKAVKGGEGVEELKKQLKETQDENAKLKRETSRLKRERAGLRAQLKE